MALAERLADTPTPAGPTPKQLGTERAFIALTDLGGNRAIAQSNRHTASVACSCCPATACTAAPIAARPRRTRKLPDLARAAAAPIPWDSHKVPTAAAVASLALRRGCCTRTERDDGTIR